MPPQGFVVLPRRWVVERTFSWIDQNRRMSKDYERLTETSEAFIYVAMTRLMVSSAKFASKIVHITSPESREDGLWGTSRYASGDYM
jgi:hypothetical protein